MRRAVALVGVAAVVVAAVATLQSTQPGWWDRLWYPLRYDAIVRGHARHYDLDPSLLAAVIYEESKFKANARSRSGAIGLMQLLPNTAEGIALHTGGDAFRGGLLYGIERGFDWETTGRLASLIGSIKIAHQGPQNHTPSRDEIGERFQSAFGYRYE